MKKTAKKRPTTYEKPLVVDMDFDEFVRRIVRVPKSEIEEQERKEERKKARG